MSAVCLRSGRGAFSAASTRRPSSSSGAKIFASTSLSSVKCRTSSFGRAVITSAKCVIAGKISIGSGLGGPSSAPREPRAPKGRALPIEDLGGLLRVWRKGWALRPDVMSAGGGFAVFIVCAKKRRCFLSGGGCRRELCDTRNEWSKSSK